MERLTGRDVKLGFVDSDTLPSYATIYEQLQKYENLFEDKEVVPIKELPQKKSVRDFLLSQSDFEQKGYQMGWNACIDKIINR